MAILYNCHSHIFNIKNAPERFFGPEWLSFGTLLSKPLISSGLAGILSKINPFSDQDKFNKLANFVLIGREKNQQGIFEVLLEAYEDPENLRVVVLTMDMDYMGAGKAINNFETQLTEVARLIPQYKGQLLPFVGVDPRRKDMFSIVKKYIEEKGFVGIKLYPALGYYPFDTRLEALYAYAVEYNLPVMTHCDTGGIFYRGSYTNEHLKPSNLNPTPIYNHDYSSDKNLKNEVFKNHFTNPRNYEEVLKVFPDLKICLAHYGGYLKIEQTLINNQSLSSDDDWHKKINEIIKKNKNVYTDISYTLFFEKFFPFLINNYLNDPNLKNKILFGTDFYMTIREKSEDNLVNEFINRSKISPQLFHTLSVDSPIAYLTSKKYIP